MTQIVSLGYLWRNVLSGEERVYYKRLFSRQAEIEENYQQFHVASVSVRFRSKERVTRVHVRVKNGPSKRAGRGEEERKRLQDKLREFENCHARVRACHA